MTLKNSWLILIILFIFIGCKKEVPEIEYDFRTKYIGVWDFAAEYHSFDMSVPIVTDTIRYYQGYIKKNETNAEEINIKFEVNKEIKFKLGDDGSLIKPTGNYSDTVGKFINENNIHFSQYYGGLGGGTTMIVDGTKVE